MADNNSFFSKKVKSPSTFDGVFDGDGYNAFYVGGVEVGRFDSQGLKLSSGTAVRQGNAPAGGVVVNEDSTSSTNTPLTLVASQSGQIWFNSGSAKRCATLPAAQAGLKFTFIVADADGYRVQGAGSDTIRYTVATSLPTAYATVITTAGGYAESTMLGSRIDLQCISTAASIAWMAVATGVWSPLI